jgi:hypothetical protein
MYLDMMNDGHKFPNKIIPTLEVPLKIKIFSWFLSNKVVETKEI